MALAARSSPAILNSWKEIATYLGRGVRTVQRWEHELSLPVHRIGNGKRSPVYALIPQLKFWLTTNGTNSVVLPVPNKSTLPRIEETKKNSMIKMSRQLIAESQNLIRAVAEASSRQQRKAEILQKRILEMRSRLR
jgi:hypothetical protein